MLRVALILPPPSLHCLLLATTNSNEAILTNAAAQGTCQSAGVQSTISSERSDYLSGTRASKGTCESEEKRKAKAKDWLEPNKAAMEINVKKGAHGDSMDIHTNV